MTDKTETATDTGAADTGATATATERENAWGKERSAEHCHHTRRR